MHNHSYCCEHLNIKFCKLCQIPYCTDCHTEWGFRTWQYYSYPHILQGNTGNNLKATCSGQHEA